MGIPTSNIDEKGRLKASVPQTSKTLATFTCMIDVAHNVGVRPHMRTLFSLWIFFYLSNMKVLYTSMNSGLFPSYQA